jgi:hypothetical protein
VKVTSCLVLTEAVKQPGLACRHAALRVGEFEVAKGGGIWVAVRDVLTRDILFTALRRIQCWSNITVWWHSLAQLAR